MACLITKKDIMNSCDVLPLDYRLTSRLGGVFGDCFGYNAGAYYGWNCDFYRLEGEGVKLVIAEGYRPCSTYPSETVKAWRRIFKETVELYDKALEKTGRKRYCQLDEKTQDRLNKRYRNILLKKWKAYLLSKPLKTDIEALKD